jgi:hypothetical protein
MFSFARRFALFTDFLVATSFALPDGKNFVRIAGGLVNSAVGRNYFPTAARASSSSSRSLFNVNL